MTNNVISVERYTLSAWKRCHPDSDEAGWDYYQSPTDIFTQMERELHNADISPEFCPEKTDIRFVMIDEEYFEWLRHMEREDCPQVRKDYVKSVSDEKARRLFAKHNMNIAASLVVLSVMVPTRDEISGRQRLSQEQIDMISREMQKRLDVDGVFVSGILADPKEICDDEYAIKQAMLRGVDLHGWETDNIFLDNMCGLSCLVVPVLLFKSFDNPVFSLQNDEALRDFYFATDFVLNPDGGYEDPFPFSLEINGEPVHFHVSPFVNDLSDMQDALEMVRKKASGFIDRVSDVFRVDLIRAGDDGAEVMTRVMVPKGSKIYLEE